MRSSAYLTSRTCFSPERVEGEQAESRVLLAILAPTPLVGLKS